MCSCRDDVRVLEGGWYHSCRHEPADVRHVGQQPRAGGIRHLPHARIIDVSRIRARSGNEELSATHMYKIRENCMPKRQGEGEGW